MKYAIAFMALAMLVPAGQMANATSDGKQPVEEEANPKKRVDHDLERDKRKLAERADAIADMEAPELRMRLMKLWENLIESEARERKMRDVMVEFARHRVGPLTERVIELQKKLALAEKRAERAEEQVKELQAKLNRMRNETADQPDAPERE